MYNEYILLGLCSEKSQIKSRIVLAGDPKQLDAVTKSKYALKFGFNKSLMQHLMERRCFQPHPITKRFDPNAIVLLTKNYRSHEHILHIPNELFYESRLEAKGQVGK